MHGVGLGPGLRKYRALEIYLITYEEPQRYWASFELDLRVGMVEYVTIRRLSICT